MEPKKMDAEYAFTFPERESLENWEAIQSYARSHSLVITWNSERKVLCVRGPELEPRKVIDELGELILRDDNSAGKLRWDIGWRTTIQVGGNIYPLLIEGESDDAMAVVQRHRLHAEFHVTKHLNGWIQSIVSDIYPVYLDGYCNGNPCSREIFEQALGVTDVVVFDPEETRYEVYLKAGEFLSPHLIHLTEIPGVLLQIDLE